MVPFKQVAVIAAAAVLVLAGWLVRGWFEDSKDLAAAKAMEDSRIVMRELAGEVAKTTEQAIGGIRIENRTIYTAATKEIIRETIYADCILPDAGRMRANQARSGAAAGKSDGSVPSSVATP